MIFLSCYNLIKNNCNGWCQGCSDCPGCYLYHEGTTNKKFRNATRWEMIKYVINSNWEHKWEHFKMSFKKWKEKIVPKSWTEDQDNYIKSHSMQESMVFLKRSKQSVSLRLWRLKKCTK
jgi:hypothetical protein